MNNDITKSNLLDKKFQITKSGTLKVNSSEVLKSDKVQQLLKKLKSVQD